MRAAFLHEDSRDIEDAVRGATDATDEVPDDLDRIHDEVVAQVVDALYRKNRLLEWVRKEQRRGR